MNLLGEYKDDYEDIYFINEFDNYKIYIAYNKKNQYDCWLKVINKEKLKLDDYDYFLEQIKREEEILLLCKSEYTVNLYKKFETNDNIIFEYEYMDSNLYEYMTENGELEREKEFFKEIILRIGKALKILHQKGIIHRNIRPNSIFIKSLDNDEEKKIIKLGNYNSSIYIKDNKSESIGNIYYSAPEIIKNLKYDEKCDLWSLGITLYELYFGELPFYNPKSIQLNFIDLEKYYNNTHNIIIEKLYDEKNFKFRKSKIPTLDILFKRLLVINPKERMTYDEFFEYIFNDNFMRKDFIPNNNYKKIYDIILKEPDLEYYYWLLSYMHSDHLEKYKRAIIKFTNEYNFPDFINFSYYSYNLDEKYNNIIYYNEDINNLNLIYKECDIFERNTHGSFILCINIELLKIIKEEILRKNKKDKRIIFNLIVTGNKCEKIMNFLKENKEFENCLKNICIYCLNVNKYLPLKDKYKIIKDVYNKKSSVINFINNYSSKEIKPFPITKIITYENYLKDYKDIHFKISQFYGDLSVEEYMKYLKEMKIANNLFDFKFDNDFFKPQFEINRDIKDINQFIITKYKENIFYDDLSKIDNNSLYMNNNNSFEVGYYLTSRVMFFLNSYAINDKKYYNEDKKILYKGEKLYYSSLIKYERIKGKIILFSNFTTVYEDENYAKIFSGRNESIELYNNSLKFSVIFIITNLYKNNWISNILDFNEESNCNALLFQPFSFFHVRDVKINLSNYTADIYLETIGKIEILEEKIRLGKTIEYNEKENIIDIKK